MTRKSRPTGAVRVESGTMSSTFFPASPRGERECATISRTCRSVRGWPVALKPTTGSRGGGWVIAVITGALLNRHGREAAVHDEVLAGDEGGGARRGQPDDGAGQLVRLAEAGHRRVADDLLAALRVGAV